MTDDEALAQNRRMWDAAVAPHAASSFYDVEGFLAGADTVDPELAAELEPLAGRDLVHLQCHFGLDTLSLARRGARVTGVDFSPAAVARACALAERAGLPARFVEAEVGALPAVLDGAFDRVFTGGGALCWLPDLAAWGRAVARLLRPGGRLVLRDYHPAMGMFAPAAGADGGLRLEAPYFRAGGPSVWGDGLRYASDQGPAGETVEWAHGLGEVACALLEAGLTLECLREYNWCSYRSHDFLVERRGRWEHPAHPGGLPLMFLIRASRPA